MISNHRFTKQPQEVPLSTATAQAASSKQVVMDFFDLAFVQRKPADAARDLMGPTYTQHNPDVPDGKDAFVGAIGGMFQQFPDFSSSVKRVIAEDDVVVIHHHVKMTKEDRGSSVVDIFRVGDGKIVEHWDIIQPVPETPANDNTMF
jgi:predicted SnoaL-like aldol condensation-catalyzing enzyme